MKLPFDFGIKLFLRLLVPGFLLTLGLAPLLFILWDWLEQTFRPYLIQDEIAFVIVVMLLGWVVIACDMYIYMFLEGRRFWPEFLRTYCRNKEENRLSRIYEILGNYDETSNKYLEASVELRKFPVD
jgi:hypothetical protein